MGHGVAYVSDFTGQSFPIAVTGPQRVLARGMDCHLASPFGDMMLSGSFGLVEGAETNGTFGHATSTHEEVHMAARTIDMEVIAPGTKTIRARRKWA